MDAILNHRSIRKYKSTQINDVTLNQILHAGSRASTTGNMQVYSMVVTRDEKIREQLWEAHFKQDMVKQAPVVVTFCADINRFNKWCEARNTEPAYDNFLWYINAAIDALLAAQNVSIAAEEKGLGICYLGTTTYMARKIIDILNLPKGVVPVTTVVIGYSDEKPELTDRLPLSGVVHYEKYNDFTRETINEIYAEKESLESTLKLVQENETDNLAQIFTQKRYKKDDNLFFSKEYLKVIEEQGFMNND